MENFADVGWLTMPMPAKKPIQKTHVLHCIYQHLIRSIFFREETSYEWMGLVDATRNKQHTTMGTPQPSSLGLTTHRFQGITPSFFHGVLESNGGETDIIHQLQNKPFVSSWCGGNLTSSSPQKVIWLCVYHWFVSIYILVLVLVYLCDVYTAVDGPTCWFLVSHC